jgi:acetyl esterase/lipase
VTMSPELAALARDADKAMATAGLRLPASAPASGQRTGDWEADVAACRAEWDAFITAAIPDTAPAVQHEVTISDVVIGACGGRLYKPAAPAPAPAVVFYHGGAFWITGGEAMRTLGDPLCRRLAASLGAVILSVDYRLAPEHKYPEPVEDCFAAWRWIATESGRLGVDPSRVGLYGISSGGNMAAATALRAAAAVMPLPRVMVLMVPALDLSGAAALADVGFQGNITSETAELINSLYVPPHIDRSDPGVSPGLAPDLTGVPPTFVVTGQYDPLRDMGVRFAARLKEAGIPASAAVYPMTHTVALPGTVEAYTADVFHVLHQALANAEPDARRWFPDRV